MTERTLLDARWIGQSGIGRVTSSLIEGLCERPPGGPWTVWLTGERPLWGGAEAVVSRHRPGAWAGQRCLAEVPPCEVSVFPANLRPLRPVGRASLTVLYDTIPLQHEPNPLRRRVLRGVFLRAAHLSTRVLTISEHSARGLVRELGLAPDRIGVLPIPFDRRLVDRIEGARSAGLSADPSVLFVGRMTPHKNLERLVRAFSRSHTHRIGGRLVLAGESGAAAAHLRRLGHELGVRVDTPGALSEDDLVREYARSWAVALVSLDEGLGLPVLEATAAGIPVVASNAGGIMETVGERLPLVDPLDELAIARGIDQAVGCEGRISSNLVAWTRTMPEASDLAAAVVREVDCLRRPPG